MDLAGPATALSDAILSGNPAAVARGITWCEQGGERLEALEARLPARTAHVVGVTGPAGAGKSTLLSALIRAYTSDRQKVGVIAVDPSSPLTGGALLGDRVRIEVLRGAFFRSLATRGALGGLSNATWAATRVLSAAGFQTIFVETVGAGQSEVQILRVADSVILVLFPGAGDEMQVLKSGIMEIADIYILNKADRPGIDDLRSQVGRGLRLRRKDQWTPPILLTMALQAKGIDDILEALGRHKAYLQLGAGQTRNESSHREAVTRAAKLAFNRELEAVAREGWNDLSSDIAAGKYSDSDAARELTWRVARRLLGQ